MTQKITGPEILDTRFYYMSNKSIWFFIDILNSKLKTNIVNEDGSIEIIINYNMSDNIIKQIVDIYLSAGWDTINITSTVTDSGLYGYTKFIFIPPELELEKLKRKIISIIEK